MLLGSIPSTPRPLLFNIFMCDIFLVLNTTFFTGYADGSSPFVVRDNIPDVRKALEEVSYQRKLRRGSFS